MAKLAIHACHGTTFTQCGSLFAKRRCVDPFSKHRYMRCRPLRIDLEMAGATITVPARRSPLGLISSQLDLGAELIHGDETSLYRLAVEKGWEMEELISLAQGDGGPLPADGNDGFGLFYLGGEKRMLAMDSKVILLSLFRSVEGRNIVGGNLLCPLGDNFEN